MLDPPTGRTFHSSAAIELLDFREIGAMTAATLRRSNIGAVNGA
jgi:hypothetical protein